MTNKFINKILIILITMIIFFIDVRGVNAESSGGGGSFNAKISCTWYTYQTFIDSKGNPVNGVTLPSSASGEKNDVAVYELYYEKSDDSLPKIVVKYNNEKLFEVGDISASNLNNGRSNVLFDKIKLSDNFKCPTYVSLSYDGGYILSNYHSSGFKNYLKNQYDEISGVSNLNKNLKLDFKTADIMSESSLAKEKVVFTSNNMGFNSTERYDKLKSISESFFKKTKLDRISETSSNFEYYETSVSMWDKYIDEYKSKDLRCDDTTTECSKIKEFVGSLEKWFEVNWHFMLEDNLSKFKLYYEMAYSREFSEDTMNNILESFTNLSLIEQNEDLLETLEKNECNIYCLPDKQVNVPDCKSNNENYKKCIDARKSCSTAMNEYKNCLKKELGNSTYKKLEDMVEEKKEKLREKIEKYKSKIGAKISSIDTSLSGVEFGKYKTNCDDVKFLHTFYTILRVLAPLLVILMGTLDYTKSVLGADEKKILEARKKFPKRLILLILFILIPFIISILLDMFSVSDTSLMSCVIKGS